MEPKETIRKYVNMYHKGNDGLEKSRRMRYEAIHILLTQFKMTFAAIAEKVGGDVSPQMLSNYYHRYKKRKNIQYDA